MMIMAVKVITYVILFCMLDGPLMARSLHNEKKSKKGATRGMINLRCKTRWLRISQEGFTKEAMAGFAR